MKILCGNPAAQYRAHQAEIDAALHACLESGRYILGENVRSFEREFSDYLGVTDGVGVGSGTDALHVALAACGVGAGDEVITVAHTAVATVAAVEMAGATPVLVDIDPGSYTIDPAQVERAVTAKTKAIVPVHLYGLPADLTPILAIARARGIRVIEDCAQAHGASYLGRRVGSFGDLACFSFYPTKNLGALGDGGMVVTSDADLARRARLLREYGWAERYVSQVPGWNTRLDELQAAVLRVKLRHLDEDNARRARLAALYQQALAGCDLTLPACREGCVHAHHLYVIRSSRRDELRSFLRAEGIEALIHYPVPVHLQPAYAGRLRGADRLEETERAAREVLSLPMYPELSDEELCRVTAAVCAFEARS